MLGEEGGNPPSKDIGVGVSWISGASTSMPVRFPDCIAAINSFSCSSGFKAVVLVGVLTGVETEPDRLCCPELMVRSLATPRVYAEPAIPEVFEPATEPDAFELVIFAFCVAKCATAGITRVNYNPVDKM